MPGPSVFPEESQKIIPSTQLLKARDKGGMLPTAVLTDACSLILDLYMDIEGP
jgi:hypothetical protein